MIKKLVSILIPIYNEKDGISRTLRILSEFLDSKRINWEFICVDDGSTDGTDAVLRQWSKKDKRIRIFTHSKNLGQARALKTGFINFNGSYILTIDSDLSFPVKNIERILFAAENSDADIWIGTYYKKNHYKNVARHRIIIGKLGNIIYKLIFPVKLRQYTCNFRLYKRDIIKDLEFDSDSRFVGKVSIILELALKNARICQIPVTLVGRKKGKSKFKFTDILMHMRFALRIIRIRLFR